MRIFPFVKVVAYLLILGGFVLLAAALFSDPKYFFHFEAALVAGLLLLILSEIAGYLYEIRNKVTGHEDDPDAKPKQKSYSRLGKY